MMSDVEVREDSFIVCCLRGDVRPEQIHEFVEAWHAHACPVDLPDFLGMDWSEYEAWIVNPAVLPTILQAHRERGAAVPHYDGRLSTHIG